MRLPGNDAHDAVRAPRKLDALALVSRTQLFHSAVSFHHGATTLRRAAMLYLVPTFADFGPLRSARHRAAFLVARFE